MPSNILVTGAAGYIGGSVITEFISRTTGPISVATLFAAVRSQEQVHQFSKLTGVKAIQLDLEDEEAVKQAVLQHEINIIVHTASSFNPPMTSYLIRALGQRREISRKQVYFIHSSVTALFSAQGGWPYGDLDDTDPTILEKEKHLDVNPVRENNIVVADESRLHGVTSFNLVVSTIYGRGTGQGRKLSAAIPAMIRTSMENGIVYKFDNDGRPPAAHISDLSALYGLLLESILRGEEIPSGDTGYYVTMAHSFSWWEALEGLAKALHTRGLVKEPQAKVWPTDEMAAEKLGFPLQHVRTMGTNSGGLKPVNAFRLGWQPKWDEKKFLESLDDEIQAVKELDTVKSTLFDTLIKSNK